MTFMVNFGPWGGLYFRKAFSARVCLGYVAFTFVPMDVDILLEDWMRLKRDEAREKEE